MEEVFRVEGCHIEEIFGLLVVFLEFSNFRAGLVVEASEQEVPPFLELVNGNGLVLQGQSLGAQLGLNLVLDHFHCLIYFKEGSLLLGISKTGAGTLGVQTLQLGFGGLVTAASEGGVSLDLGSVIRIVKQFVVFNVLFPKGLTY